MRHVHVRVLLGQAGGGLGQQSALRPQRHLLVVQHDQRALPHTDDPQRRTPKVGLVEGEGQGGRRGRAAVDARDDVGGLPADVLGVAHDDDGAVGLGGDGDHE